MAAPPRSPSHRCSEMVSLSIGHNRYQFDLLTADRLLPLSAVLSPGTLNIQSRIQYQNNTMLKPAQPQQSWYGTQGFASCQLGPLTSVSMENSSSYREAECSSPSADLYSVTLSSVAQRGIIDITPPDQNSSYQLSFFGPALNCSEASGAETLAVNASVAQAREVLNLPGIPYDTDPRRVGGNSLWLRYNAWPLSRRKLNSTSKEAKDETCYNVTQPFWHNITNASAWDINSDCVNADNVDYFFFTSDIPKQNTMVLITCQLHNASYDVSFSYENSRQNIDVRSVALRERIKPDPVVSRSLPDFKNIVYSAIFRAFNDMVLSIGLINSPPDSAVGSFLYFDGYVQISALRDFVEGRHPLIREDVITAIKGIFQNITISTMGSVALAMPESEAAEIEVDIWRSGNVYVYNPMNLYIGYAWALTVSLMCVCWGFFVIYRHNQWSSYSMSFSTILRTTRYPEIDAIVCPEARKGTNPVPDDLLKVNLLYNASDSGSEGCGFHVFHQQSESTLSVHAEREDPPLQSQQGPSREILPAVEHAVIDSSKEGPQPTSGRTSPVWFQPSRTWKSV